MKYIIGASIGGLFGLGMPLIMAANDSLWTVDDVNDITSNEVPRQEEFQPTDPLQPTSIENKLILPDNICGYIDYESEDIKEQAKECLSIAIPAI